MIATMDENTEKKKKKTKSKNKAGDREELGMNFRHEPTLTVKAGWGGVGHGRNSCAAERMELRSQYARQLNPLRPGPKR
jgi:hypothetical protein